MLRPRTKYDKEKAEIISLVFKTPLNTIFIYNYKKIKLFKNILIVNR